MQVLAGKKTGRVTDFDANIWRLQAQGDIRGLIAALKHGDMVVRRRAAMALRMLGTASAIPALQDVLLAESDPSVREILVSTLAAILDQLSTAPSKPSVPSRGTTIAQLIARLSGQNVEHAVRSAQELADQKEKLAVEALMVTFNSRELAARVRLAAAEALIKLESAPMEVTLLAALRSPKWNIRRSAAAMLGQLEADWAVEPLISALRDEHERVRATARAALEHINTPEARRAIEIIPAATHPLPVTGELPSREVAPTAPKSQPASVSQPAAPPSTAPPNEAPSAETSVQPLLVNSSSATTPVNLAESPPAEEDTRPMPPAMVSDDP